MTALFPKNRSLVMATLSGAFQLASGVYLVFELAHGAGATLPALMYGYSAVALVAAGSVASSGRADCGRGRGGSSVEAAAAAASPPTCRAIATSAGRRRRPSTACCSRTSRERAAVPVHGDDDQHAARADGRRRHDAPDLFDRACSQLFRYRRSWPPSTAAVCDYGARQLAAIHERRAMSAFPIHPIACVTYAVGRVGQGLLLRLCGATFGFRTTASWPAAGCSSPRSSRCCSTSSTSRSPSAPSSPSTASSSACRAAVRRPLLHRRRGGDSGATTTIPRRRRPSPRASEFWPAFVLWLSQVASSTRRSAQAATRHAPLHGSPPPRAPAPRRLHRAHQAATPGRASISRRSRRRTAPADTAGSPVRRA